MTTRKEHTRPPTVTWLVLGLTLAMIPHFGRLPLWISLLAVALMVWRLGVAWWGWQVASAVLRIPLTVVASIAVFSEHGTVFGRDAGVALFVTMLALKLLESFRRRDLLLLGTLNYFLVLTHFFYSQNIPMALYMLLPVMATTTAFIDMQAVEARRPALRLRETGVLLIQAVPLMLVMFFVFPRLASPLWSFGGGGDELRTGLGSSMSPGSFTDLIIDDSPAFRVKFDGLIPPQQELYWRGRVLWEYDGTTWNSDWVLSQGLPRFEPRGERLSYRVTLEPHDRNVLLGLDLPIHRPRNGTINQDFELSSRSPVRGVTSYEMDSLISYVASPELDTPYRRAALRLPDGYNPRTLALAQQWRGRFADDRDLIRHALQQFREQEFVYSFTPPLLGRHAVDEFLFDTREGFCEHYAGAFAYLMRAAGIPARVLIGYQGGVYNPVGDYLLVRHSDAHAWTELWLPDGGWTRFDPTAMVAPERVRAGLSDALPETRALMNQRWFEPFRMSVDAVQNLWNEWVISYDSGRRLRLFRQVGLDQASLRHIAVAVAVLAVTSMLGMALVALRRLSRGSTDPLLNLYAQFVRKLEGAGLKPRHPSEGPMDYAARARLRFPRQLSAINRITTLYVALRYAGHEGRENVEEFRRAVRALRIET